MARKCEPRFIFMCGSGMAVYIQEQQTTDRMTNDETTSTVLQLSNVLQLSDTEGMIHIIINNNNNNNNNYDAVRPAFVIPDNNDTEKRKRKDQKGIWKQQQRHK